MTPGQTLSQLTSKLLFKLENHFVQRRPDLILAHGDTTTCFATALSSFYHQIPFFHVEAGLRSHRLLSPFPEEFNRQSIAPIAQHHFAPTILEKENLLKDGVSQFAITVTGSTVHEAVQAMQANSSHFDSSLARDERQLVVVTLHRREAAQTLEMTLQGLRKAAFEKKDALFVCPVHPNPAVQKAFQSLLGSLENVALLPPLEYPRFVSLLLRAQLVVTDSGGVQEEAAFLGKTVLLARQETERQDGLKGGLVKLVGREAETMASAVIQELDSTSPFRLRLYTSPQHPPTQESASERIAREVRRVVG